MRTKTLWQCPTCKRKFAKRRQWHSCLASPVDAHFKGKPAWLKPLFGELSAKLKKFGRLRIDAVKTSINLASTFHFGGVRVQEDSLRLGFVLNRHLRHDRILRTERVGASIYSHIVKITSKEDLDRELLSWLREAYDRSARQSAPLDKSGSFA